MNYPSCIKMPISKGVSSPEKEINLCNGLPDKTSGISYDELISIADDVFGTGKWSHAVTSQTVDFVEYVMGKYHIGCAAFVRVELPDRTFHEEMGYSNAESSVKGLAVYSARASSITNALRKALLCFGGVIEKKMDEYISNNNKRKLKKLDTTDNQTDKTGSYEIIKQSRTNTTTKRPLSPKASEIEQTVSYESLHDKTGTNESVVRKEVSEPKTKSSTTSCTSNSAQQPHQPEQTSTTTKGVDNVSAVRTMTEEELRNERKRKQREKQEEYRRLMMKDKDTKVEEKVKSKF